VDEFLEERLLYIVLPVDTCGWETCYDDEEAASLLERGVRQEDAFEIRDGLLFKEDKLYVPRGKREEVLRAAHADRASGHGGVMVTMARLEDCWWPTKREQVEEFVRNCLVCQLRKADKTGPYGSLKPFEAAAPLDIVSVDTLGPMKETLNQNRFVIVAVDAFTRFLEAKALKTVTAKEANEFLLEYLGRYGAPKLVITDQGSQFKNELVSGTFKAFGSEHRLCVPDHGQGNSFAERSIQTLQEKLSLSGGSDNWDVLLPATMLAINTSVNARIKISPYEMLFGRRYAALRSVLCEKTTPQDIHTQLIKRTLEDNHLLARNRQAEEQEKSRKRHEASHKSITFPVGSKVLVRISDRRRGKLSDRYKGPFDVLAQKGDVYTLGNGTGKTIERHVASLKKFCQPSLLSTALGLVVFCCFWGNICCQLPNAPVLWRKVPDSFVWESTANYEITMAVINPCDSLREAARKFEKTAISATKQKPANVTYAPGLTKAAEDPHLHMADKCDEVFREEWESAVTSTLIKCAVVHEADTVTDEGHSKRGLVSFLGGAAGGFVGFVVTDLIGVAWDYLNPYSDHNQLGRVSQQVSDIVEKQGKVLNAFSNATRALSEGLNMLGKQMADTRKELAQVVSDVPEFIFSALKIFHFITEKANSMKDIGRGCEQQSRFVNMKALATILQHKPFENVPSKRTYMFGVKKKNDEIVFQFTVVSPVKNTNIYEADPFRYWEFDNVRSMRLNTYVGEKFVMYNHSADCAKAIRFDNSPVIYDTCEVPAYHDPALSMWTQGEPVGLDDVKPVFQMKSDFKYNHIYCFPANITVNNISMPCENRPLKLGIWVPFQVPHVREYKPTTIRGNVTLQELEFGVSYTHVSNTTYAAGTLALYKKIAELQDVADRLREEGKLENVIGQVKMSSTAIVWINIVLVVILAAAGGCLYCFCCKKAAAPNQTINLAMGTLRRGRADEGAVAEEGVSSVAQTSTRKSFRLTSPS
jgi:transposase InsO family protein